MDAFAHAIRQHERALRKCAYLVKAMPETAAALAPVMALAQARLEEMKALEDAAPLPSLVPLLRRTAAKASGHTFVWSHPSQFRVGVDSVNAAVHEALVHTNAESVAAALRLVLRFLWTYSAGVVERVDVLLETAVTMCDAQVARYALLVMRAGHRQPAHPRFWDDYSLERVRESVFNAWTTNLQVAQMLGLCEEFWSVLSYDKQKVCVVEALRTANSAHGRGDLSTAEWLRLWSLCLPHAADVVSAAVVERAQGCLFIDTADSALVAAAVALLGAAGAPVPLQHLTKVYHGNDQVMVAVVQSGKLSDDAYVEVITLIGRRPVGYRLQRALLDARVNICDYDMVGAALMSAWETRGFDRSMVLVVVQVLWRSVVVGSRLGKMVQARLAMLWRWVTGEWHGCLTETVLRLLAEKQWPVGTRASELAETMAHPLCTKIAGSAIVRLLSRGKWSLHV